MGGRVGPPKWGLGLVFGTLGKEPNVTICYVELLGRMHTCVHLFKSNFGPDAHLCTGGVCTQVCKVHTCVQGGLYTSVQGAHLCTLLWR